MYHRRHSRLCNIFRVFASPGAHEVPREFFSSEWALDSLDGCRRMDAGEGSGGGFGGRM